MPSHDVRISVEHYETGGYGVISPNYASMGLSDIDGVKQSVEEIMLKELKLLRDEEK